MKESLSTITAFNPFGGGAFAACAAILGLRDPMQRLFSTFPGAWPGFGLLVLRCAIGFYLFDDATKLGFANLADGTLHGIQLFLGVLLVIGYWTPVAAGAQCLFVIHEMYIQGSIDQGQVMRLVVGICLAFLGPGSLSLDSRLFGRKRIEVPLPTKD